MSELTVPGAPMSPRNGPNLLAAPTPSLTRSGSFSGSFRRKNKTTDEKMEGRQGRKGSVPNQLGVNEYNIILLGDLGVGKTALAVRFVTRRYLHEYDTQLEQTYTRTIQVGGKEIGVRLIDTVDKTWDYYEDQADGFLLVYSITSLKSLQNAKKAVMAIRNSDHLKSVPIILTGNKIDLDCGRCARKDEQEAFASEYNCLFVEITVADTPNLDHVIERIMSQILYQNKPRPTATAHKQTKEAHPRANHRVTSPTRDATRSTTSPTRGSVPVVNHPQQKSSFKFFKSSK